MAADLDAARLGTQVQAVARRSVTRTLRQRRLLVLPVVFPLILFAINGSALASADRLHGFPPVSYRAFALAVPFLLGGMLIAVKAGTDLAQDIQSGFVNRLALTPLQSSGLGSRKQQVLNAGASLLDLAVAMLETDTMQASSYAYGDGKTGDAANFGIFKQNWYMLRTSCSYFSGQTASQYNNGAILNTSLSEDVSCISQSQSHYGLTLWFAGQRDGQTGLSDPNQSIITEYQVAVEWIESQLNSSSANLSNDTRFWVSVPAI